ncbi:hypothetical protein [Terrarubrum flagellatum]|uniref:hypothetical protein n=1 Tax=Terrirubrum flagellatum TaxID=2895980 RepID=UPI003145505B
MSNKLDIFNSTVALVLLKLYEKFPGAAALDTEALHAEVREIVGENVNEKVISDSIIWLANEGFIRDQGITYVSIDAGLKKGMSKYVLTSSGLTCLNKTPNSLKPPLGEQLKETISEGSREAGKNALGEIGRVVGEIIGGVIKGVVS